MVNREILQDLKKAILDYDKVKSAEFTKKAISEGIDPMLVMDELTAAIRQVGDGYGQGYLFLPELVGAAEALQNAMPIVENAIKETKRQRETLGTVVLGSVAGDIHTIGKSMVGSLLIAEGFEVHDVGINTPMEKFIEAVKEYNADILAMSALLSTTAPEAKKVINALEEEGIRDKVKVMVGGGAITADFAKNIKADGYDPTAAGAVKLARNLLGI